MKKESVMEKNIKINNNGQEPHFWLMFKSFWNNEPEEKDQEDELMSYDLPEEDRKALLKALKDTDKLGKTMLMNSDKKAKKTKGGIKKSLESQTREPKEVKDINKASRVNNIKEKQSDSHEIGD